MRLKLVPEVTHFDFIGWGRYCVAGSLAALVGALAIFLVMGLNFGVDFKGGTIIELRTPGPADLGQIRGVIDGLGLGDFSVQEFGEPSEVLIQTSAEVPVEGAATPDALVMKALQEVIPDIELRRVEFVGPKVSGELIEAGILAVVLSLLAVLVYVWLRFEWQFAVGAVASLAHDVVLTIGLFSLVQLEFNLSIVAALLTIVGYSLNDTVVVFDRVRENLRRYKSMPMKELLNLSVNETLSRTTMTSFTTLIALVSLYVLGGEVIRGFTFGMIWGVVIGTYSSIFIAAMILLALSVKRDWSKPSADGPAGVQFGSADAP
ncbi:protein translocase subunit SecF [Pikeienuella piscinae]|uniref:Protein-export membrane protein SecF n=1 Tax=Pikeienuella piscinae TaxID=2748098 RepID=A0A7L5BXC5_9RHOB|nr:protein translocase subunit SecF [Pikeienuella piscinae]QIE54544.1 protein translocase subunit SecF [Pikeienuella piscinae]